MVTARSFSEIPNCKKKKKKKRGVGEKMSGSFGVRVLFLIFFLLVIISVVRYFSCKCMKS